MAINADPNALAIATFKAAPLSMGDCFIKVLPQLTHVRYEVVGQFVAIDTAMPNMVSGALRGTAEGYLAAVVAAAGGLVQMQEVDGPLGKRMIAPGDAVAGSLVNPFSGQTYAGLYLTEANSDDSGGRHFKVNYVFVKPLSVANDGTADSTILFDSVRIGNRGGHASITADGAVFKINASSQYVWTGAGPLPLTYLASLANTLGLNQYNVVPLPRGVATNRAAIKSYNSLISTFEWLGRGTIATTVLESLDASQETPGIFTINATFTAKR